MHADTSWQILSDHEQELDLPQILLTDVAHAPEKACPCQCVVKGTAAGT